MKRFHGLLALLALLIASCEGNEEPQPQQEEAAPVLVSTSPAEGIGGIISASLSIVFTYDQNIKCTLEAQKAVTVDGGAVVDKVNAYGKDLTITVSGLTRGSSYTVTLPAGTVQGYKENQKGSAAVSFHFGDDPAAAGGSGVGLHFSFSRSRPSLSETSFIAAPNGASSGPSVFS